MSINKYIHQELIEGAKHGKRADQKEIYDLYAEAMFNVSLRMTNSNVDAEDILQESFIDAFNHLHQFKYESTFGAWLKRIVVNNSINHLKKNQLRFDDLDALVQIPETKEEEFEFDDQVDIIKVKEALKKLPDGYRQILQLYLIEAYDHNEISEILDIAVGTSRSQYLRAKKKLISIYNNL